MKSDLNLSSASLTQVPMPLRLNAKPPPKTPILYVSSLKRLLDLFNAKIYFKCVLFYSQARLPVWWNILLFYEKLAMAHFDRTSSDGSNYIAFSAPILPHQIKCGGKIAFHCVAEIDGQGGNILIENQWYRVFLLCWRPVAIKKQLIIARMDIHNLGATLYIASKAYIIPFGK